MEKYCLGFAFSEDFKYLVLIKKNRPEWQKGLLNGVGGKVDTKDESFRDAMIREFFEETNVLQNNWKSVGLRERTLNMVQNNFHYNESLLTNEKNDFCMEIFATTLNGKQLNEITSKTDESVSTYFVGDLDLKLRCVPGLVGIIDLCRCAVKEDFTFYINDK